MVSEGRDVARTVCVTCHAIAPGQPAAFVFKPPPRSFQDIADDPATSAKSLRRFITTTHWDLQTIPATMPDLQLMDQDYKAVVAYILSLRSPALPQPPRQPLHPGPLSQRMDAGEELALRQCSFCHVVSSDTRYRPSLIHPAPGFQEIADEPGATAESLRRFITTTHWDEKTIPMTMPDQMLSGEETNEVIAYMLSLRKRR